MQTSPTLSLRVRGPLACFTRPEFKVERFSYPIMTPSAARGIIESVLWKPAISWSIERIVLLKEIRFASFRRNEVDSKAVAPPANTIALGGIIQHYFADEHRTQRNTIALRDVDYIIEAHFEMTRRAGKDDNMIKFTQMFERRVLKGQHWHQPYLGCREFIAEVLTSDGAPKPIPVTRDLGIMLWDISFGKKINTPIFFDAHLVDGILDVPSNPTKSKYLRSCSGGDE